MFKTISRACVAVLIFASVAAAQVGRASITGTVTDPSGAVVAGATVTVTNLDTRVVSPALTNDVGIYSVVNLPPGNYSVEFAKTGFAPFRQTGITLNVDQVAQLNALLNIGTSSQTITVTANAPILDKETSDVGTNLKGSVVQDLPLSIYGGRTIESFAVAITPGYAPLSDPYTSVINGTQGFTKDVTVDGTSTTASIEGDSFEIAPSMEAVAEVQSETTGLGAQNGITSGGVIMLGLKSGTNKFHGSAFGFGHNEFLDANTWDNNNLGIGKAKARFWDWGFSAGGPIRKDKTFIFGAFERYTQNDFTPGSFSSAATVPTQAFLSGDFSALLNKSSQLGTDVHGNPIYSGAIFNPSDPGAVFANNMIPTSMFSSVSQKILALYQKSYAPENSSLIQNDRIPSSNSPSQTPNQAVIKVDQNFSDKNHLSGSWVYNHRPRTLIDSGGVWQPGSTDGGPLSDARSQLVYAHEMRLSDSYTLRPSLLNVLNLTYNWYWNGSLPASTGTNWPSTLGFGNTGASNFPNISFGNSVNGVGETFLGSTWQGNFVGATFILGDSVSWTKGKHSFSFGGDFRAMELNNHAGSGALSLNFSNNTTGMPSASYANQVGFGFASFLLGNVESAQETTALDLYGRRKAMSLFAADNWKVTPKVTMNLGLRWDATFRFHEKYGHWANFDLNAVDPNLGIPGAIEYAKNGSDSFEKNEFWKNFGPHIGLAYSPFDRWVLRGSFGILYTPIGIQYWGGVPYGFAPGFRGTNAASAPFNWDQGYPGVFTPGTFSTTPDISLFPIASTDPNALRDGYVENWNAGVQYEITKNTRLEVSYIANRGHHLQDATLAANEPSASTFFGLINSGNAFNWVCDPAGAAANGVKYPYSGFCAPALSAIAPYPQISAAETTYWYYPVLYYAGLSLGQSSYDSMVVEIAKRTGSGLTMDLNYTLSRQLGDTFSGFGENYGVAGIQDFSNLSEAAHTLSPYDQKHVVKGYVSYQLPFGNDKRWLTGKGRVANAIVNGWTVSGLMLYASGQPLSFSSSNYYYYPAWAATYLNYDLSGYNGSKFNSSSFVPITDSEHPPAADQYFPATVAVNPAYGQLGTGPARIDALRGPGIVSENASLLKYFRFGHDGRYALSFRAEFYNLFNRHAFGNPNTDVSSPEFGYITGVNSAPRTGQFGARFQW
ncbi:MAG TPA: TonB-dependent receptor [Terriglobia bacterium]|nr:TonB-dependent receptor [Terriglobia bacterium]